MEKFSWADRVRNDELHRVKEKNNILHTTKKKKEGSPDYSPLA